jgi:hypothetical protein
VLQYSVVGQDTLKVLIKVKNKSSDRSLGCVAFLASSQNSFNSKSSSPCSSSSSTSASSGVQGALSPGDRRVCCVNGKLERSMLVSKLTVAVMLEYWIEEKEEKGKKERVESEEINKNKKQVFLLLVKSLSLDAKSLFYSATIKDSSPFLSRFLLILLFIFHPIHSLLVIVGYRSKVIFVSSFTNLIQLPKLLCDGMKLQKRRRSGREEEEEYSEDCVVLESEGNALATSKLTLYCLHNYAECTVEVVDEWALSLVISLMSESIPNGKKAEEKQSVNRRWED